MITILPLCSRQNPPSAKPPCRQNQIPKLLNEIFSSDFFSSKTRKRKEEKKQRDRETERSSRPAPKLRATTRRRFVTKGDNCSWGFSCLSTLALQTLNWTNQISGFNSRIKTPQKWLLTAALLSPRATGSLFTKFHPEKNVESCRAGQIEISSLGHPLKCGSLEGVGGGQIWVFLFARLSVARYPAGVT